MKILKRSRILLMKLLQSIQRLYQSKVSRRKCAVNEGECTSTRTVRPLDSIIRQRFPKNAVINSKYTPWNFLILNISEQFSRPLNRYFLLIALLQFIREIAPVNPMSTVVPLLFAFTLTAIKDGYDDYKRHQQDHLFNNRTYLVWNDATCEEERRASHTICVGDILKIHCDEELPCDVVVLQSSSISDGVCYIRTDNLDGEIDLKPRHVPHDLIGMDLVQGLPTLSVECPCPDSHPYAFDSTLTVKGQTSSMDSAQLLPQSCYLKKTEWVLGMAVYTGNETKCFMSKKAPPLKWSQLDQRISKYSLAVLCFQLTLSVIMGSIGLGYEHFSVQYLTYLAYSHEENTWNHFFIIPARFFLLTSVMIPISFKVIVDISKYIISQFIMWDVEMVDEHGGARVSNTTIAEDLGQVQYIMTDKTGTLTENQMKFRACSVGGECFGVDIHSGEVIPDLLDNATFRSAIALSQNVQRLLEHMSLCHTATVSISASGTVQFHSASPDEECLVQSCATMGFVLHDRSRTHAVIRCHSPTHHSHTTTREYEILEELPFVSSRKRMSVVVRDRQTGQVRLLVKGADDVVFARATLVDTTVQNHVDLFASKALRTLVMAERLMTLDEVNEYRRRKEAAKLLVFERESTLHQLYDKIETGLTILGATGIEDKLQEGVPETIQALREGSSIRMWMLTGDKYETACQVARSCRLVGPFDNLLSIRSRSDVEPNLTATSLLGETPTVLVVEGGEVLDSILQHWKTQFLSMSMGCEAVVCCRVTPIQKALITGLIKESGKVTLSIGDGGNDVPMIQEAHVGVGLRGKEGSHASRAADFCLGKFRFLMPLLLVHGHYSYMRTSYIVQYSFYKSMLISFMQIVYNCFALFCGISYWNTFMLTMWNGVYTLPTVFAYTLDRSVPRETLLTQPFLYGYTQRGCDFTSMTFLVFLVRGQVQGAITLLLTLLVYGQDLDFLSISTVSYSGLILLQTATILLESHSITIYNNVVIWGMLLFYIASIALYSASSPHLQYYGVVSQLFSDPIYWLIIMLIFVVTLLPHGLYLIYVQWHQPNILHKARREKAQGHSYLDPSTGVHGGRTISPPIGEDVASVELDGLGLAARVWKQMQQSSEKPYTRIGAS